MATSRVFLFNCASKCVPIKRPRFRNHPGNTNGDAALLLECTPWRDVGVMIQLGNDNFVRRVDIRDQALARGEK